MGTISTQISKPQPGQYLQGTRNPGLISNYFIILVLVNRFPGSDLAVSWMDTR